MIFHRTITSYESDSNRLSDNTSPKSINSEPHSLNSIDEFESGGAVTTQFQLPPDVSKNRNWKHESSVDSSQKSQHIDMLTKYITKEQTEIEAWCTSLSLTLSKLPEFTQAEMKLAISNLVGQKEMEYLKTKNNHHCATPNVTNEYDDNNYLSCTENFVSHAHNNHQGVDPNFTNDYNVNDNNIRHDSFAGNTVVVHSKYTDSYATLTRL